ncbi:MAG: phosphatidylserine decarboxylase family protein [Acidobacteria bacterium]|nr:phosphatidylserine decarboxylase family protein [Acidobacteriota bacterium]
MVITGVYYALAFGAAALAVSWLTRLWYAAPLVLLALFFLWFFRDPERTAPAGDHAVSPADGKVTAVKPEGERTRISVFLSPIDVHVNRSPVAGQIVDFEYRPGKFLIASAEEASVVNEQNVVTVKMDDGVSVIFKQIAGLVARRVIFQKKAGDRVAMGERIGLMQFSSRMDILLVPAEWDIVVKPGDRVSAATSIIARRRRRGA